MSRRIFGFIIIVYLSVTCAISSVYFADKYLPDASTPDTDTPWQKVRVADSNLYSDNGYIDYAKEVVYDNEAHPEMEEMGLFWTRWDEETQQIVEVRANTAEGAALVDTSKPTIVNVHGMLGNGHVWQENYFLHRGISPDANVEFDIDNDDVSLNYLWLRAGWNVANFHYNRFASENPLPENIESKIWAIDGVSGERTKKPLEMRYRKSDGTYVYGATGYTISEFFAAEYIRAINMLPDSMGDKEIRFAAHSMGGQVTAATLFLLTELADDGQLSNKCLPDRYALLDAYFSVTLEVKNELAYWGPTDITIRWSGKPLVKNNAAFTMIEALKDLAANGIALEYYTFEQSALMVTMAPTIVNEVRPHITYIMISPDYGSYNDTYDLITSGHNGVRDWYYCSITSEPPQLLSEIGGSSIGIAPSASMSTDMLRQLKGNYYKYVDGSSTVTADDDTFIQIK